MKTVCQHINECFYFYTKKKGEKVRTSPRKTKASTPPPQEESRDVEEEVVPSQASQAVGEAAESDTESTTQQLDAPFTEQQDDLIAQFFEDHKYYYDMTEPDYKNKRKREHMLVDFARTLGFTTGKCISSTKFRSLKIMSNNV